MTNPLAEVRSYECLQLFHQLSELGKSGYSLLQSVNHWRAQRHHGDAEQPQMSLCCLHVVVPIFVHFAFFCFSNLVKTSPLPPPFSKSTLLSRAWTSKIWVLVRNQLGREEGKRWVLVSTPSHSVEWIFPFLILVCFIWAFVFWSHLGVCQVAEV